MTLRVRWEGDFFSTHSLSLVNRELVLRLARHDDLTVGIRASDLHQESADPRAERLRPLSSGSDPVDVCVRHAWPLDPHPPRDGKWVAMQPWEYGGIPRRFYEPLRFGVDELWVLSQYNRLYYVDSGIPEEKIRVVPCGVAPVFLSEPSPYPLRTRKRFKFLFVGGTILRKGIDLLIDAYLRTFGPGDDVCLVLKDVGVASQYQGQTYDRFIRELQLDPSNAEIEYIPDALSPEQMRDLYHACDCLAHPYRGEGFGLPVAEAMACGLPVIVPDQGSTAEFCTPETAVLLRSERQLMRMEVSWDPVRTPWWIEPNAGDLCERMREIQRDPESVRALAERGKARVRERLTWERAAELAVAGLQAVSASGAPLHADARAQAEARLLEGVHAWSRDAPDPAIRHFALGRAHHAGHVDLEYNLATVLMAREDYRTAIPLLTQLAEHADRSSEAVLGGQSLVLLAGCQHALGRSAEAAVTLRRAAVRDPANADVAPLLRGVESQPDRCASVGLAERPRVRWRGAAFNATGYADEGRNFALGLHALGWELHLAPHDPVEDRGILDAEEYRTLRGLLRGGDAGDGYALDVQHVGPNLAVAPVAERSVIRTMFETDRISAEWAEVCNRFTEVWVPSEFNRATFARSGVVGEKIRVVPGALDAAAYDPGRHRPLALRNAPGFRFLSVFDWTPRKGWDVLLRAFVEEFEPDEEVTLVVKTTNFHNRTSPAEFLAEYLDRQGWKRHPRIELIDRHLSPRELIGLYLACHAFVLPSRGEGWGRPYMEAMALGRPVIGTRWSANLTFMNDENSYLIDVDDLVPADAQGWDFYRGHLWAEPSLTSARKRMREVFADPAGSQARGQRARADVVERYDRGVVARQVETELRRLAAT